jgi:uncharacterized membrane protein
MTWITAYIFTAIAFFAIDFPWLGTIAMNFYFSRMSHLLARKVNYPTAAGFYAVYVVGLIIFAVAPAIEGGSWQTAATYGALFRFFCYATHDMTNQVTLKNWPFAVAVVDVVGAHCCPALQQQLGILPPGRSHELA